MAANLRSAIRRAASRVVSEDLLILLRGPRPNPAEAEMLAKKADEAAKRHSVILLTRSLIEEQKQMYESPKWKAGAPLFATMGYVLLFLTGYESGREDAKQMYERQEREESN